jgi:flagellar biosynthesis chaperone FliJ
MAKIKTKFDSLVKLKKLKVSEIEREIIKINNQLSKAQEDLKQIQKEITEFEMPKEGSFSLITQFKIMLNAMVNQKKEKEEYINFLNNQKNILQNKLKEANLEYEKMKYLQGEEIKKYLKDIKQKEAKDMDEIALMLYKG